MPVVAQEAGVGNPAVNMGVFLVFVSVTLIIVFRASRSSRTALDYYAAGSSFTGAQNGVALAGDYLSAAAFLGVTGLIAVYGLDGFLYAILAMLAWLVVLLLVAELLRNTGRYTMGDVLSFRMRKRPVRAAAATSTLVISFLYLVAQMAGAGALVALLLNVNSDLGQSLVITTVGGLMVVYVLIGGMRGTTWVQIIKGSLLMITVVAISAWVLGAYGLSLSALAGAAADNHPAGQKLLEPGLQYGESTITKIDFLSLAIGGVLGPAGLPHILMRFYTVPTGREARKSVVWAIWLIGIFYLFSLVLGYGAAALVGPERIAAAPGGPNSAAPLLAFELGGVVLLGFISAVAFATILAVVAGLTITASASFAHDVYANVIKHGEVDPDGEVRVARITALVIGALAIVGGIFALSAGLNIAFLVALAFAVAASANLPAILYSLFWKRFNTSGVLWSMYGGLISCVVLIAFSPVISGKPVDPATGTSPSLVQGVDFSWFPLDNPGLVSIPLSFILGIMGTLIGRHPRDEKRFAEMEVRSLTGAGSEKAVPH